MHAAPIPPDVLASPCPGALLAQRYRLVERIGEGGMATVWDAVDTATGLTVAVKVLGRRDEVSRARFFREGRLMAAVDHPHVVHVASVEDLPHGGAYMVLERLYGVSLADRLTAHHCLSPAETAALGASLLDALAFIHARGIVHRDLKPENVFLTETGGVKLLDFGIAIADDPATLRLTRTGSLVGTPVYMAPEQLLEDRTVGPPADVWALGIVLYECIAGRAPTDRDNLGLVFQAILAGEQPPLGDVAPSCPSGLTELIMAMLLPAPEMRPSPLEARRRLASFAVEPEPRGATVGFEAVTPRDALTVEASSARPAPPSFPAPPSLPPVSVRPEGDRLAPWDPVATMRTTEAPPPGAGLASGSRVKRRPLRGHPRPPRGASRFGRRVAAAYAALVILGIGDVPVGGPEPVRAVALEARAVLAMSVASARATATKPAPPPRAPSSRVRVSISASPPSTRIFLDGRPVGHARFRAEVPRSDAVHRVTLSAPGHVPLVFDVSYAASTDLDLKLSPRPASAATAWLRERPRPIERDNPYR